jgi:hypothetical protein
MLRWSILEGEINLFVSQGRIQPYTTVLALTARLQTRGMSAEALEQAIRDAFEPSTAAKLIGKHSSDRVDDELILWESEDGHDTLDAGWIVFASEIDWDAGILKTDWVPNDVDTQRWLFPSGEFLDCSEFEHADFEAEFRGLAFSAASIEMMLPNHRLHSKYVGEGPSNAAPVRLGRPLKWDWEGALSYIIAQAQTPDGLPTGHGSQARLEEMIAEWFITHTGDSPAQSQIRNKASKIVRTLQKA